MENSTKEKETGIIGKKVKFTLSKSKYVYMKLKMYVFVCIIRDEEPHHDRRIAASNRLNVRKGLCLRLTLWNV